MHTSQNRDHIGGSCFAIELGDTVVENLPALAGGARDADSIPGSATFSSILA